MLTSWLPRITLPCGTGSGLKEKRRSRVWRVRDTVEKVFIINLGGIDEAGTEGGRGSCRQSMDGKAGRGSAQQGPARDGEIFSGCRSVSVWLRDSVDSAYIRL